VVAEPASGDQPNLGVHLFGSGVRQFVAKRRLDPRTLFGDRLGELDERLKAAAPRPLQPGFE
jgi:hypothetical protein